VTPSRASCSRQHLMGRPSTPARADGASGPPGASFVIVVEYVGRSAAHVGHLRSPGHVLHLGVASLVGEPFCPRPLSICSARPDAVEPVQIRTQDRGMMISHPRTETSYPRLVERRESDDRPRLFRRRRLPWARYRTTRRGAGRWPAGQRPICGPPSCLETAGAAGDRPGLDLPSATSSVRCERRRGALDFVRTHHIRLWA
jgi:hypothetical protein